MEPNNDPDFGEYSSNSFVLQGMLALLDDSIEDLEEIYRSGGNEDTAEPIAIAPVENPIRISTGNPSQHTSYLPTLNDVTIPDENELLHVLEKKHCVSEWTPNSDIWKPQDVFEISDAWTSTTYSNNRHSHDSYSLTNNWKPSSCTGGIESIWKPYEKDSFQRSDARIPSILRSSFADGFETWPGRAGLDSDNQDIADDSYLTTNCSRLYPYTEGSIWKHNKFSSVQRLDPRIPSNRSDFADFTETSEPQTITQGTNLDNQDSDYGRYFRSNIASSSTSTRDLNAPEAPEQHDIWKKPPSPSALDFQPQDYQRYNSDAVGQGHQYYLLGGRILRPNMSSISDFIALDALSALGENQERDNFPHGSANSFYAADWPESNTDVIGLHDPTAPGIFQEWYNPLESSANSLSGADWFGHNIDTARQGPQIGVDVGGSVRHTMHTINDLIALHPPSTPGEDQEWDNFPQCSANSFYDAGWSGSNTDLIALHDPTDPGNFQELNNPPESSANSLSGADWFGHNIDTVRQTLQIGVDVGGFVRRVHALYEPHGTQSTTDRFAESPHNMEMVCQFCWKNKELPFVYLSHALKNVNGIVVCPILRRFECPLCGIRGDNAHTLKYCPRLKGTAKPLARKPMQELPVHQEHPNRSNNNAGEISVRRRSKNQKICKFCKRNCKPPEVYFSHRLINEQDVIECPYLRYLVCEICGATGDNAHTKKYCPYYSYNDFINFSNRYFR